jgi:hypothetical protein
MPTYTGIELGAFSGDDVAIADREAGEARCSLRYCPETSAEAFMPGAAELCAVRIHQRPPSPSTTTLERWLNPIVRQVNESVWSILPAAIIPSSSLSVPTRGDGVATVGASADPHERLQH